MKLTELNELATTLSRYISSLTVYEIKLLLETEGKQTADLWTDLLRKDFSILSVDWELAKRAALVWKKHRVPTADAVIAATAMHLRAFCVTNDEHFLRMKRTQDQMGLAPTPGISYQEAPGVDAELNAEALSGYPVVIL